MRTLNQVLTLLLTLIGFTSTQAVVLTVNNNGVPAQYNNINTAIGAASAGDTILISASQFNYGNVVLAKSLTLMGEVAWPDSGFATRINELDINLGAEGARIVGLRLENGGFGIRVGCSNILIERCEINSGNTPLVVDAMCDSLEVRHCFVQNGGVLVDLDYNLSNSLFRNNIFHSNSAGGYTHGVIAESNQSGVVFRNNIFILTGGTSYYRLLRNDVQQAIFENNIFWGSRAYPNSDVTSNWFNNNISFGNSVALPTPNNGGTGNMNTDPLFVNAPNDNYTNTYDYDLQSGSPGENAGTDATDIGIHGGSYPWPNYNGYPDIPLVTRFVLQDTTVSMGSNVNAEVDGVTID